VKNPTYPSGDEERAWMGELIDGKVPEDIEPPEYSWWPLLTALGATLFFLPVIFGYIPLMAVGALIILVSIVGWGLEISYVREERRRAHEKGRHK
jgi:hypothetical protein